MNYIKTGHWISKELKSRLEVLILAFSIGLLFGWAIVSAGA